MVTYLASQKISNRENFWSTFSYHFLGISNRIACYSETKSGTTAVYFCLMCGFTSIKGYSTRTCLLNGSWTGSIPQCNCNCNHDIVTQNVTDNDDTCIPNVTSTIRVSTNFSDRNPGNVKIVKSPWFFWVTITFGCFTYGLHHWNNCCDWLVSCYLYFKKTAIYNWNFNN